MRSTSALVRLSVLWIALAGTGLAMPSPQRPGKTPVPADQNRFTTVDDFLHAHRAPRTTVSVEGYAVLAWMDGKTGLRLGIVDSVDHVLSVRDAIASSRSACVAFIPASALKSHPKWALTATGMARFAMYARYGRNVKQLHDTVAKLRITGSYAPPKSVSPVTLVEYQNDNGEWTKL